MAWRFRTPAGLISARFQTRQEARSAAVALDLPGRAPKPDTIGQDVIDKLFARLARRGWCVFEERR